MRKKEITCGRAGLEFTSLSILLHVVLLKQEGAELQRGSWRNFARFMAIQVRKFETGDFTLY